MDKSRFTIYSFDSLPSTQILAREWCEQGTVKPGDVVHALTQTAGYGRRGRSWDSPEGNLYFTLVENLEPSHIAWLGYAMGLALHDAIKPLLPVPSGLFLKWPNDLLLNGAKLSGLLLEVAGDKILLGVGVNTQIAPDSDQKTSAIGQGIGPRALLERILTAYEQRRRTGLEQGFPGLRADWQKRAIGLDDIITARLADGSVLEGHFVSLDDTGALVLAGKTAHHTITSADIYLKKHD